MDTLASAVFTFGCLAIAVVPVAVAAMAIQRWLDHRYPDRFDITPDDVPGHVQLVPTEPQS